MREALIIFSKNPKAGKVKTRLAATIGNEAALTVYHQLLAHTVSIATPLPVDKFVFYSDHVIEQDIWDNSRFFKEAQKGNDLGERMQHAFQSVFQKGYGKIVIIGTDCLELTTEILVDAFSTLQLKDVVIGPAHDGGYYLLGVKELNSTLFENMSWSTDKVQKETMAKCDNLHLEYFLLPMLRDIDKEEDLHYFKTIIYDQHHHPNV